MQKLQVIWKKSKLDKMFHVNGKRLQSFQGELIQKYDGNSGHPSKAIAIVASPKIVNDSSMTLLNNE